MCKTKVNWVDGMAFSATPATGHTILMDSSIQHGGRGKGPTPMELVLTALGGCTGMDIVNILGRMGVELSNLEMELHGERDDKPPMVFRKIDINYTIKGKDVSQAKVRRAIDLSKNKYCSVSAILTKTCDIRYTYEIIDS